MDWATRKMVRIEIEVIKQKLCAMDYKTSKWADGEYTTEQWTVIAKERRELREKIRALEAKIEEAEKQTDD